MRYWGVGAAEHVAMSKIKSFNAELRKGGALGGPLRYRFSLDTGLWTPCPEQAQRVEGWTMTYDDS